VSAKAGKFHTRDRCQRTLHLFDDLKRCKYLANILLRSLCEGRSNSAAGGAPIVRRLGVSKGPRSRMVKREERESARLQVKRAGSAAESHSSRSRRLESFSFR